MPCGPGDPAPLTLRELLWMAEAQSEDRWAHTSSVLAMIANVNRKKGARAFMPDDFNPLRKRKAPLKLKADIGILKRVFVQQGRKR